MVYRMMIDKRWSIVQAETGTYLIKCNSTNEVLAYNIRNLNFIEKILGWSSLTPESQTFLLEERGNNDYRI